VGSRGVGDVGGRPARCRDRRWACLSKLPKSVKVWTTFVDSMTLDRPRKTSGGKLSKGGLRINFNVHKA